MPTDVLPAHNELLALSEWFAALRRAGWFSQVPADEWHTLSALLSFPHHDGASSFTPEQLAYVLGTDEAQAAARLDALAHRDWGDRPLLTLDRDAYGGITGAFLALLGLFETGLSLESGGPSRSLPIPQESKAGTSSPASPLVRRLEDAGLYADQIDRLLSAYPEERIRRQLDWLPARRARVPAALLVRAIEGDWGPVKEEKEAAKEGQGAMKGEPPTDGSGGRASEDNEFRFFR